MTEDEYKVSTRCVLVEYCNQPYISNMTEDEYIVSTHCVLLEYCTRHKSLGYISWHINGILHQTQTKSLHQIIWLGQSKVIMAYIHS